MLELADLDDAQLWDTEGLQQFGRFLQQSLTCC